MEKGGIVLSITICLSISSLFYILSLQTWDSAPTAIAFNLLIAFITLTSAAWTFVKINNQENISSAIVLAGLLYTAITHLGSVIIEYRNTATPIRITDYRNMSTDATQIALFSVIMLIAVFLHNKTFPYNRLLIVLISFLFIIVTHVIIIEFGFSFLDDQGVVVVGIVSAILSIILNITSCYLVRHNSKSIWPIRDLSMYILFSLFFILANSAFAIALLFAPQIWLLGICLTITSFLIILVAISSTIYESIGFTHYFSTLIPLGVALFFTTPTLAIVLSNSLSPEVTYKDYYLYLMSNIGSGLLSLTIVFLMFIFSRKHTSILSYTLLLSFGLWSALHFYLAFIKNELELIFSGESLIPRIITSTLFILLFVSALFQIRTEEKRPSPKWEASMYFLILIILISLITLSGFFEIIVLSLIPNQVSILLGRPILLTLCTMSVFPFAMLQFYTLQKNKDWKNIEFLMMSFLAIWIYPCVLIGVFADWTTGWWAGQFMFFFGLLMGPALLGYLYLEALEETEQAHSRVTLYSDILSHDLRNIIQSLFLHIEIAKLSKRVKSKEELDRALKVIDQAIRIIENVRALRKSEVIGSLIPKQIDIVTLIPRALEDAKRETSEQKIKFDFSHQEPHSFVSGSELLVILFTNLFSNAIRYSKGKHHIEVKIDSSRINDFDYWRVQISDHGRGITPEVKSQLFQGHLESADGTGLGLYVAYRIMDLYRGSIEVSDRVEGDHTQGTTFTLLFPKEVKSS